MSMFQWAAVLGVGAVLSAVMSVPPAAGALLYGLGFWVSRRPMTQRLLQQTSSVPFIPVMPGAELGYNVEGQTGAGVRVGHEAPSVVHVQDRVANGVGGRDVIDAAN